MYLRKKEKKEAQASAGLNVSDCGEGKPFDGA